MTHTKEPWKQGYLLNTPDTRRMSAEEASRAEAAERLSVFSQFSAKDWGCSRKRIAMFEKAEDAARAAVCVNALAGIENPEEWVRDALEMLSRWESQAEGIMHKGCPVGSIVEGTRAILTKAKGGGR